MEPAAKKPTRDPPVLLHACKEFALFGIKACSERRLNVNEIIQLTTLKTCPSMCSLQSSDSDSSLTYRSPAILASGEFSPTYAISPLPALNVGGGSGGGSSHGLRSRSQSECGPGFPLKGILKRRPICRSLSECHDSSSSPTTVDQSVDGGTSLMATYCQRCKTTTADQKPVKQPDAVLPVTVPKFDCRCFDGGDCSDIVDDEISAYSMLHNKKSVTFSERVEENIFRPGSSILGQRKKNQRKAKSRKRKESCDSMLSLEEICEDGAAGSCQDDDEDDNNNDNSGESPLVSPTNDNKNNNNKHENDGRRADQRFDLESDDNNPRNDHEDDTKSQGSDAAKPDKCPDYLLTTTTTATMVVAAGSTTDLQAKSSANNSTKNCKKKKPNEKKSSTPPPAQQLIACDKYKGFLLNPSALSFCSSSPSTAPPLSVVSSPPVPLSTQNISFVHHLDQQQRLNSVDSALSLDSGEDEGEEDNLNNNNNNSYNSNNDQTTNYCSCMECASDSPPQLISIEFGNRHFDQSDCSFAREWSDRKDSGVDEDMEQLCERMCDALIST